MPRFGWPHTSKPGRGATIDWTNPLATGLLGFYALNEGAGPTARDATGNLDLATTGSPTWAAGAYGAGLNCPSAGQGAVATIPTALQASYPITVAVAFRQLGNAGGSSVPVAGVYGNNSNSRVAAIESTGVGVISGVRSATSFGTASVVNGSDYVAAFTVTPTTATLYVNGIATGSGSGAFSTSWFATAQFTLAGAETFFITRVVNVLVYWGGWWNRAFSAAEHASLAGNPWQLIAPSPLRSWVFFQGAAASYRPWIYGDQIESNGTG